MKTQTRIRPNRSAAKSAAQLPKTSKRVPRANTKSQLEELEIQTAKRLLAMPSLSGAQIIFSDSSKTLMRTIEGLLARTKTLVAVAVASADANAVKLTVGIFQNPALRDGAPEPLGLAEKIAAALKGWKPPGSAFVFDVAPPRITPIPDKFLKIISCGFTARRKDAGEAAESSQRVNDPYEIGHDWVMLLNGDTRREPVVGLFAAPDGSLYLWQQPEGEHSPRKVDLVEALAWLKQIHGEDKPRWLPPIFPDDSTADKFIYEACTKTRERNQAVRESANAGDLHRCVLAMDSSVLRAMGLLDRFARRRAQELERIEGDGDRLASCSNAVAKGCSDKLQSAFIDAENVALMIRNNGMSREALSEFGRKLVPLDAAVAAAVALLDLLADELTEERDKGLTREEIIPSGFFALSDECGGELRAGLKALSECWMAHCPATEQRLAA